MMGASGGALDHSLFAIRDAVGDSATVERDLPPLVEAVRRLLAH